MATVKVNFAKDGKTIISYRFRACIGRDAQGKQIFSSKTVEPPVGLTPARALKEMKTQAGNWEKGLRKGYIPVKHRTFRYFIENEFLPLHVCNGEHSPSTQAFYKDICRRLTDYFGDKYLESIGSVDIEKYLQWLRTENNYSANYIGHHRTVLLVAFNFAEKHDLIERNPMRKVNPINRDKKEVDFLSEEEAKAFLLALQEKANLFWKTAMNVFIHFGLRRGELAGIQWGDIDFEESLLKVQRGIINNRETGRKNVEKEPKTESSVRVLPIPDDMNRMLQVWKKEQESAYGVLFPNAYIFGSLEDVYSPIRPDSITQWLDRFCSRYGETYGFHKVSPHDLRHTVGTILSQNHVPVKDIQTILGHADASTTSKFYIGTDTKHIAKSVNVLASALATGT